MKNVVVVVVLMALESGLFSVVCYKIRLKCTNFDFRLKIVFITIKGHFIILTLALGWRLFK